LLGKGPWSIPDPTDKVPQDEDETKSSHSDRHFCVILVILSSGRLGISCM